ncbi:MAG: host attachment family protein [Gammaproteobacteria bacterium]|jgi:protein required for attachment to host cells
MNTISTDALVVVADGRGARVFRNKGTARALALHQEDLLQLMNANDDGPAGAVPPETDGKELEEATFAKQLAQRLNRAALDDRFQQLVLVADPQTLGQMRPLLHDQVRARLVAEIAKTLTNSPVEDIQRALA